MSQTTFASRLRTAGSGPRATARGRASSGRPPWMERPHWYGQGAKAAALVVLTVIVLYPFVLAIGTSLAGREELNANGGYVLLPKHPTLEAYRVILSGGVVTQAPWSPSSSR